MIVALVIMAIAPSYARDEVTRDANVLPEQAKNILKTHFPKIHINHIKVDKHTFGGDDYDVVLNDGTELDFDNKGNLKEIDCGASAVPATLILKPIRDYVANNFSGQKIVTLDINSNYYDIELSNGVDLVSIEPEISRKSMIDTLAVVAVLQKRAIESQIKMRPP